jgi:hypothetical protein
MTVYKIHSVDFITAKRRIKGGQPVQEYPDSDFGEEITQLLHGDDFFTMNRSL